MVTFSPGIQVVPEYRKVECLDVGRGGVGVMSFIADILNPESVVRDEE
ncbi:hypothetical protein [Chlorobium limicola]|nr:hypothetical protein [Chlorobium limicola]